MATITLSYDDDDIKAAIAATTDRLRNLQPRLAEVGEYLVLRTRQRFDAQEDPDGNKWAALKPAYARAKALDSRALDGILTYTGALRDTITYQIQGQELAVGSPMAYAAYHQLGTSRMPKRAFLGISAEDKAEILEILLG